MKRKQVQIATLAVTFAVGVVLGALLVSDGGRTILKAMGVSDGAIFRSPTAGPRAGGIPTEHQGKLQLFILAGQSNMSGMGAIPKSETDPTPNVYVFGNDYHWKPGREPVDDPSQQVDTVSIDLAAGVGPGLAFAKTLLEKNPDLVIGLIPCAKGGSLIHEWKRNLNDDTLYGSCLKRVRAASVMGNVAGLLYFQGEIDTVDPQEHPARTFLPHRWADEFTVLVRHWRSDLSLPELPVVFAQIGTNTEPDRFKNWAMVKEQQRTVRLPFSAMITTDDLALQDYVHFTTESYQIIGQRFARAYWGLSTPLNAEQSSALNSTRQKTVHQ